MALSRDALQERIAKIILRGEFRIQQQIERAKWEERVLYPLIEDMKAGRSVFGAPAGSVLDFKVVADANSYFSKPPELSAEPTTEPDPGGNQPPPAEGA